MNVCGAAGDDAFAGAAGGCIDSLYPFDANDKFDYAGAIANTLDAGVPVTLYYGKMDTACNYVGGAELAEQIKWKSQGEYNEAELSAFEVAGVEIGQTKSFGGLTYYQWEMSGHMVGLDEGAASSASLESLTAKYRKSKKEKEL